MLSQGNEIGKGMMVSQNQEPNVAAQSYEPGVYMLTGINGSGKSTVVDMIAASRPGVISVHASLELSKLFNGSSREELETLSAEEKLGRMVAHFTTLFDQSMNDNRAVIMDTHLLVPIRKDGNVTYENIWSDEYSRYVRSMAMITATADTIRGWRLRDEAQTGRIRNVILSDIEADQTANIDLFHGLIADGSLPDSSRIVESVDGGLAEVTRNVEAVFGM